MLRVTAERAPLLSVKLDCRITATSLLSGRWGPADVAVMSPWCFCVANPPPPSLVEQLAVAVLRLQLRPRCTSENFHNHLPSTPQMVYGMALLGPDPESAQFLRPHWSGPREQQRGCLHREHALLRNTKIKYLLHTIQLMNGL